jgi:trehalose 6-phosphate phosphatase
MAAIDCRKGMFWTIEAASLGLFLDVDGTLLDIAQRPEMVQVEPQLVADLAAAERALGGAVALISGRRIADLDALFAPLRLAAGGVHGAELRRRPEEPIAMQTAGCLTGEAWQALCRLLVEFPGTYAENKGASFAVHFTDPGTDMSRLRCALVQLLERFTRPAQPLRLVAGRAVFEIQLAGFDKGRAVEWFMQAEPFRGRRPVFIGDDEIDRPGFEMALALGGFAFSVGADLPGLSGAFAAPEAVRAWLHGFGR